MNKWNVALTEDAQKDIRDIYNYIAKTLSAPEAAKSHVKRIFDTVHSLETMPFRYSLYDKEPWRTRGLRSVTVNHYIVFYIPVEEKNEVVIFHVFYGGRDIQKLFC